MNTIAHHTSADEAAAIWMPAVGLTTGETVKLPGGLSYAEPSNIADREADRLAAGGKAVKWSGARRIA
ncbi:hypothetical protein [Hydrogenophaga sp.]|uniref:hypothetical protein n=1 Tax=Hydrogenophaga sp. TaxID=1904254 RepID=UPI0035B2ED86